jgi:hypothetical protein
LSVNADARELEKRGLALRRLVVSESRTGIDFFTNSDFNL